MPLHQYPLWTVLTSSATYGAILATTLPRDTESAKQTIKTVSSWHSVGTTILALYALKYVPWPIEPHVAKPGQNNTRAGDLHNPMIEGKSAFGNALTAWETGYLIYDTGALFLLARSTVEPKTLLNSGRALLKDSPVFVAHHIALASALGYLQTYIAAGREKGVWVIVAFMLMNASNPFLHLRWHLKRKYGRVSNNFDVLLAVAFALSRFGLVSWVMKRYGDFHGLDPWSAYLTLRRECKSGVAMLLGLNALWWAGLVRKIARTGFLRQS